MIIAVLSGETVKISKISGHPNRRLSGSNQGQRIRSEIMIARDRDTLQQYQLKEELSEKICWTIVKTIEIRIKSRMITISKPPNNKDPFPVDQKIMEFECHQPTVKIDEILTHVHGAAAAAACLRISNFTEQRLVRLENNIATILRYLYRIGSRMFINCIYYGGQTTFVKYRCIRCLKDDRAGDAANVQLDQCLTCTRYEPIYGQVNFKQPS